MKLEDQAEIVSLMQAARDKARGYADFFGWAIDRDLEEWGVVVALAESMHADGTLFFSKIKSRRRPNDPPDCEALGESGQRLAIEVTELVDGPMIHEYKRARKERKLSEWAEWNQQKFIDALTCCITKKDRHFPALKDPPYSDGYMVVIHTDEPGLPRNVVEKFLDGHVFQKPEYIDRALLLLSYDPSIERCPYFELKWMANEALQPTAPMRRSG